MRVTDSICKLIKNALAQADGGELFIEDLQSESFVFQDNSLSSNSVKNIQGFGLRAFYGQETVFFNSSDLSEDSIKKAADFIKSNCVKPESNALDELDLDKKADCEQSLYIDKNPIDQAEFSFAKKVALLKEIYNYTLLKSEKVKKVIVCLSGSFQKVQIVKSNGQLVKDYRPLCRLDVSVVASDGTTFERGYCGCGGRYLYQDLTKNWKNIADTAIGQAETNLKAAPSPAGEMTVVLASGWPGIILHEAIGHGLEADFNMKKTSAFSDLLGKSVASSFVTVVDNGTIQNRRGSINVDDEGSATNCNTLIKDGVLVGYMHDLMTAKAMNTKPTGNGRRESYHCCPMPRMTNTYMLSGKSSAEEIISGVKYGIYAVSFGGGQVDITSGKFVFSSSESYLIEDGKITKPIKGATFIGDGPEILKRISAVADDLKLDSGIGTCGKEGQSVPVGVGQPTIRVDSITVGGTA